MSNAPIRDRGTSTLPLFRETGSDLAILATILGSGGRIPALDAARGLLDRLGSLDAVGRADAAVLASVPGVGRVRAARLRAALQLAERVTEAPVMAPVALRSGRDVFESYRYLVHEQREHFVAVALDARNRPRQEHVISIGSLTASIVHPREVYSPLIREPAAGVLFLHNHPSGDPTPSGDDLSITERLRRAGELLGIRVVDHVIVAREGYTSLAERGWPRA